MLKTYSGPTYVLQRRVGGNDSFRNFHFLLHLQLLTLLQFCLKMVTLSHRIGFLDLPNEIRNMIYGHIPPQRYRQRHE